MLTANSELGYKVISFESSDLVKASKWQLSTLCNDTCYCCE